tara:strand:- start:312 stop:452 length:141 start_codon:yes stop_codon:yes gene_type:complete
MFFIARWVVDLLKSTPPKKETPQNRQMIRLLKNQNKKQPGKRNGGK